MDEQKSEVTHSPVIKKTAMPEILLSFPKAMQAVVDGKKVTRKAWNNKSIYGLLKDGFLELHKDDDKFYTWTVNDGDMLGEDWIVLEETN